MIKAVKTNETIEAVEANKTAAAINAIDLSPPALAGALCRRIEFLLAPFQPFGEDHDFPPVQVSCASGSIAEFGSSPDGSDINVQIQFAGGSNQDWRIPMNMLWKVLKGLLEDTIIAGYKLRAPVKWTALNNKEPPYHAAMMETIWRGCPPAEEIPKETGCRIPAGVNHGGL